MFVSLLSLVFLGMAYVATYSVKNTKAAERRVVATHYGEELQEWLRGEKEVDWNAFVAKAGSPTPLIYCVQTIPANVSALVAGTGCSTYGLSSLFKRELRMTRSEDSTQVTILISTSWQEGNNILQVPVNTVFSVWE